MGEAVRVVLAQAVTLERAAALLDVDVTDVRRLAKVAVVETSATTGKLGAQASALVVARSFPATNFVAPVITSPEQNGSKDGAH